MNTAIERGPTETPEKHGPLFVVWFDTNCGYGVPDWWWEKPGPQPLPAALNLAAEMRRSGWVTQVWQEHLNPRPDGRWDNPP